MTVRIAVSELERLAGSEIEPTAWRRIDQVDIDAFAAATGDHQWIHVDPVLAADGPFGTTIAHGFLTLSLIPSLVDEMFKFERLRLGINYGIDKLRFTGVVPAGAEVRLRARVTDVSSRGEGRLLKLSSEVEVRNQSRPALVADISFLLFPS
jgi:acyl dehydratase